MRHSFRKRVHPLILEDASINKTIDPLERVEQWLIEESVLLAAQKKFGARFGEGDHRELRLVGSFASEASGMLRWLGYQLMPRGFENIQAGNFQSIVDLLR